MQAYTVLKRCAVHADPFTLFRALAQQVKDAVLLESKDGNGRNNVASMLFLRSALRVEARGTTVTLTCLSPKGDSALAAAEPFFADIAQVTRTDRGARLVFPSTRPTGDDLTRIRAIYPSEVLRILSTGWNLGTDDPEKRISLCGVFAYDHLDHFEALPPAATDSLDFPDYVFYLPEEAVVVDHESGIARILVHGYNATSYDESCRADLARAEELAAQVEQILPAVERELPGADAFSLSSDVAVNLSDEAYADFVLRMQEHIACGDVFQIVPSRTFEMPCADPVAAYGVLRRLNPSPYLFFVRHPDFALFGSSPETAVKVYDTPRRASIRPIAGTRRRGYGTDGRLDRDLDGRLEAELKLNEKELAEHMMLVDLARNDIARVSKPGTRFVPSLLVVERYSHVMHLVSIVEGELRDDLDALHAYLACANMGTLVGSPKIEAAKLLRRNEVDKRGPYGGAVGYLASDGEMDTAIVIRAAIVKDGIARVRAGAGVVFDSDPMAEAHETRAKASAVLRAIAIAKEETP